MSRSDRKRPAFSIELQRFPGSRVIYLESQRYAIVLPEHRVSLYSEMLAAPMQHSELTCLVAVVSTQDETHRLGGAHRFTFLGGKPIEKLVKLSAKNTFSQLCDFPEVGECRWFGGLTSFTSRVMPLYSGLPARKS